VSRPRRLATTGLTTMVLASTLLATAGCIAPVADAGAYRVNARTALSAAASEARTAALAAQALLDERVPQPYADTVVTQSEDALGPIEDSFGAVDPPSPSADALRKGTSDLLSDAGDALADARIAVRRGDDPGTRAAVAELTKVGDELDEASEALS
jgi:hypothetical protein